jgi:murein DD-endopeptidase MepM/ murein hydrolase activator NlpD
MKKNKFIAVGVLSFALIFPSIALGNTVTVKSGDTLYRISTENKISVNDLKTLNKLTTNHIFVGQVLNVSKEVTPIKETVTPKYGTVVSSTTLNVRSGPGTTYSIKGSLLKGKQVEIISSQNGWYEIEHNGLKGYVSSLYIKVDEAKIIAPVVPPVIVVPPAPTNPVVPVIPAPTGTNPSAEIKIYTVVSGDTLTSIATKFNITLEALRDNNKLITEVLFIGQKLNIKISKTAGIFKRPAEGYLFSEMGPRWNSYHNGIDISKNGNIQIVAAADGVVSNSKILSSFGEMITIKHMINRKQYETLYAHMRAGTRTVKEGDIVTEGQFLGWMGSTGNSTGQHLHFEVHEGSNMGRLTSVNPLLYIK